MYLTDSVLQALVSEHEREELALAPPSPAHEYSGGEESQHARDVTGSAPTAATPTTEAPPPVRLSIDALKVHTKIAERSFIERMIKEKAGYLLSQAGTQMLKTLGRTNQKRHQQDIEQDDKMVSSKLMRSEDGKATPTMITSREANPLLHPPFPITSLDTHWTFTNPADSMAFQHQRVHAVSMYSWVPTSSAPAGTHYTMAGPMMNQQAALMQQSMVPQGSMDGGRTQPTFTMASGNHVDQGYWPFYAQHGEMAHILV